METPTGAAHYTVDTDGGFLSRVLVADLRSQHALNTSPFSKYGLRPRLQARGLFFNRPLHLSPHASHILDLYCNFNLFLQVPGSRCPLPKSLQPARLLCFPREPSAASLLSSATPLVLQSLSFTSSLPIPFPLQILESVLFRDEFVVGQP